MSNIISYSQYSIWLACPFKWKLLYIDKIKSFENNIYMIFGNAINKSVQLYVESLFNNGINVANQLDILNFFKNNLYDQYNAVKNEIKLLYLNDTEDEINFKLNSIISKQNMVEFFFDAKKILEWLKENRTDYFNLNKEIFIGKDIFFEYEINNLLFKCYIDIVLKNKKTGQYRFIDIKSSTYGWKSYDKGDAGKTDQLLLYKYFYSKKYNIPIKNIDIEYLILKRKLYDDIPYKQKRIIKYAPSSGIQSINKTLKRFDDFMNQCYLNNDINHNGKFIKIPVDYNCLRCPFNKYVELCNKSNE